MYVPELERVLNEHLGRAAWDDLEQGTDHHMWPEVRQYIIAQKIPKSDVLNDLSESKQSQLVTVYATDYL